ncbi:MAG: ABC transporter permease [Planctomycetia bacterium]|nr:ABC transporter permease [Planctomycetia bacterium]
MRVVSRLVLANLRQHPARMALTSLAVIAAACVVIWVVSGYDALLAQFDAFADEYLGRYQLAVVPEGPEQPSGMGQPAGRPIPPEVVHLLQQDPDVAAVDPLVQSPTKKVTRVGPPHEPGESKRAVAAGPNPKRRGPPKDGSSRGGRPGGTKRPGMAPPTSGASSASGAARPFSWPRPTLVGTGAQEPPHEMVQGTWLKSAAPDRPEGVLSDGAAEQINADVGDEVLIETERGEFRLTIVGIVRQASLGGGGPRGPAPSRGPAANAMYVSVALAEKITGEPAKINCINVALTDGVDAESFRRRWNERFRREGFAAAVLDPGDVKEDMEQGFSATRVRNQSYAATGISLLAALFIILTTLGMGVDERIRQLAMLRAVGLTRGQVAAMIAVEALVITRVSPLEAMAPRATTQATRHLTAAALLGLTLIAVNPLLVFVVPMADESRYGIYAALGCTSMAVGFVLLAPLAILLTERLFAPLLAVVLRLDRRLLGTQLGGNLWRTVGTTVALSLGLGLFVAMQTWGYSMLEPFVPGDWAPDVLVCFPYGGLPEGELDDVARIEGVAAERCLPLAVEQPKLAEDITGSRERQTIARQDNVVMVGFDPERALGGADPMLDAVFVEGNREDAIERLRAATAGPVHDCRRRLAARLALDDEVLRAAAAERPFGGPGFRLARGCSPRLRPG